MPLWKVNFRHLDNILTSERSRKSTICMDKHIKRISRNDPRKFAPRIIAESPEIEDNSEAVVAPR